MDGRFPSYHLLQLLEPREEVNKIPAFVNQAQVMNVSFKFRRLVQKTSTFIHTQLIHLFVFGSVSRQMVNRVNSRDWKNQQVATVSRGPTRQHLVNESFKIIINQTDSFTKVSELNNFPRASARSLLHMFSAAFCKREREILMKVENVRPLQKRLRLTWWNLMVYHLQILSELGMKINTERSSSTKIDTSSPSR